MSFTYKKYPNLPYPGDLANCTGDRRFVLYLGDFRIIWESWHKCKVLPSVSEFKEEFLGRFYLCALIRIPIRYYKGNSCTHLS